MEKLLSANEAAEILGVHASTLATWRCIHTYQLPYVKVGRLVKYRRSDVEAFIDSRTHTGE